MNVEQVAADLARASAAEQGLPEVISDPEVLAKVAAIVRTTNERGTQGQPRSFGHPSHLASRPPERGDLTVP